MLIGTFTPSFAVAQIRLLRKRGVVTAEHRRRLEQPALARYQVALENRFRRGEGLVLEAELAYVEFRVGRPGDAVGGLVESDLGALLRRRIEYRDALQAVEALLQHQVAGEDVYRAEHHLRTMRNQLLPVLLVRRRHRRGDQAKVLRALVGADVELSALVPHVIAMVRRARQQHLQLGGRLVARHVAHLGGREAGNVQQDVLAVQRLRHVNIEQLVLLLVQERVLVRSGAELVAIETVSALGVVLGDVIQRPIVGRPDDRIDPRDRVRQQFAGSQVLDVEGVIAETGRVARVGKQVAVVADDAHVDVIEFVALRRFVDVEDDPLLAVKAARLAAMDRVLLAFLGPCVIPVVADAHRHRGVGLLNPTQEFLIETFL